MAQNIEEHFYDDGIDNFTFRAEIESIGANRFYVDNERKINTLNFFIHGEEALLHILDENFQSIYSRPITPLLHPSWIIENVYELSIRVSGYFFIGVEWLNDHFLLGVDNTPPYANNSYLGRIGNPGLPRDNENYMIRVSTCESYEYDVFISHASEDKELFVRPLADTLLDRSVRVWYDDFSLKLGDSLRRSIDKGLHNSRYGIVVLSENFFNKEWPQRELDSLVSREDGKEKVILPIWHGISKDEVRRHSLLLADKMAVSSHLGIEEVVKEILRVLKPESNRE